MTKNFFPFRAMDPPPTSPCLVWKQMKPTQKAIYKIDKVELLKQKKGCAGQAEGRPKASPVRLYLLVYS